MIAVLGDIVFEVSDKKIMTPIKYVRKSSGSYSEHKVIGDKPKREFLNAGLGLITFDIFLSAENGVSPRTVIDRLAKATETGEVFDFSAGGMPVGENKWTVSALSETWGHVFSGGELVSATASLTLTEYR